MNQRIVLTAMGFLIATTAWATDGVVLIDQNRALAGSITPGDAPGFPVTISVPGSYQLSGDLNLLLGTNGIEITADHVTLNLNGFSIIGARSEPPVVSDSFAAAPVIGIRVTSRWDVAIVNGTVTFAGDGIRFESIRQARVERIRAVLNSGTGVAMNGNGVVDNCTIANNGNGIFMDHSVLSSTPGLSSVRNSEVVENRDTGVTAQCPNTNLIGNTIVGNGSDLSLSGRGCTNFTNLIGAVVER